MLASESYTHKNWVYKNVFSGFSRMYYVIDGVAFYEEEGKKTELKKTVMNKYNKKGNLKIRLIKYMRCLKNKKNY